METVGLALGAVFWPTALIVWLMLGYFAVRKYGRPARIVRNVGIGIWIVLVMLIGLFLRQWLFLDDPLSGAVTDGNVSEVTSLLDRGANPNAPFEGDYPLVDAAVSGNVEIVRLLLKHGARTDVIGHTWQGNATALTAARRLGNVKVANVLKDAGAKE